MDAILTNLRQRGELILARKAPVCMATFGDNVYGSAAAPAATFRYTPERCSRVSRRRAPVSAPLHRAADAEVRRIEAALPQMLARHTPFARRLWTRCMDETNPGGGMRQAARGYQMALVSRCVLATFPRMVSPALRLTHPDPVARAEHLASTWNRRILATVEPQAVRAALLDAMKRELMVLALAHYRA